MADIRDDVDDAPRTTDRSPTDAQNSDRRRPGRIHAIPQALVPLLRRQTLLAEVDRTPTARAQGQSTEELTETEGSRVFFGVLVGTLLATPFWAFLAILVWWALR